MYLSGKPMGEMYLKKFDDRPIPSYTEPIQHAVFKHFIPPVSLFAFLGGLMLFFKKRDEKAAKREGGEK